jgi:glycosyltransferase involved in cell wall biosynthesis
MHFLFISTFLGNPVGGTETLMARMSGWLLGKGHHVTLLANSVKECHGLFEKDVQTVEAGHEVFDLGVLQKSQPIWSGLGIAVPDVIKAFDLPASWVATVLSSVIKPSPKVLFGNYFPYLTPQNQNPFRGADRRLFLFNLRKNFADGSILCMSQGQISEFKRRYGTDRNPEFWPLPVEDRSKNAPVRAPRWGHFVSIGRLASMKEYNLYMIDVVAALRQKGYAVTWTVYGDGEFCAPMRSRITALGLEGVIALKGTLPYAKLPQSLASAYVFVGMGTASIEAALCGVPIVMALAHDTTGITYGPLYRFTFGNVGERMDNEPTSTVEAELERILEFSPAEYEEEVHKTRDYARRYEMDATMERFLALVNNASPPRVSKGLYYWYRLQESARRLCKNCLPA